MIHKILHPRTPQRWGLVTTSSEKMKLPVQGALRRAGKVGGMTIYELVPGETRTWVLVTGDVVIHSGATLVAREKLQSSSTASLLLLSPQAVIEHRGYKRQRSRVVTYINGVEINPLRHCSGSHRTTI